MSNITLSVIIPSYKDPLLTKTIDSLLAASRLADSLEIIAVLDGYWPDFELRINPKVKYIHLGKNRGMREAINTGVAASRGKYLMKTDSHCMFDDGFDQKIMSQIEPNWVVIPRRYRLDIDKWEITNDPPVDYERIYVLPEKLHGVRWVGRTRQRKDKLIDENMVFQGSCWVMSKQWWDFLGELQEEGYGTFTQEPIEIALKTWLGGGKVMTNKTTWYAHKHRKFKRTVHVNGDEVKRGNAYSRDFWLNNRWEKRVHDFNWLLRRFKVS